MSIGSRENKIQVTGRTLLLIVVAVLVLGAIGGSVVTAVSGRSPFGWRNGVPIMVASAVPVPAGSISFTDGFAPIVEKVRPAVVNISSTKIIHSQQGPVSPLFSDPFFRQFFGPFPNTPSVQRENSLGSGVIISPDGYVLTNNHVVEGASDIEVTLSDKRVFKAKIVGTDPKTDVAVVKLDVKNLPVMVLGNSDNMKVGNFVIAAGDPFGLGQTFTMGIVSATGRSGMGIEQYEDFIQTDAAINPGNSGGALVDVEGELIGINTAIVSGGGGNEGIGFAIPINMAENIMSQIIKTGKVVRGYLGVEVQAITPALASAFGLKEASGALIGEVTPNSPAAQAGLQRGDVVLSLNGNPISDSRDLSLKIAEIAPGTTVQLGIWRKGAEQKISVKLGEMPNQQTAAAQSGPGISGGVLQGLSVDNMTPQIAGQLGLPAETKGVVVTQVQPGSLASEAGLQEGDVIQEVNHMPVANTGDFERAERQAGKQPVVLLINRGGTTLYVAVGGQ